MCNGNATHPLARWAKSKCPKCVAGRWGSVLAERYVLGMDHDMLSVMTQEEFFDVIVKILEIVWGDDHTNKKKPLTSSVQPDDEDRIDETKAAIEKRGRWFRASHHALCNHCFRHLIAVSYECKTGMAHFLYFLQHKYDEHSHLELLVYGKAKHILSEIESKHFDTAERALRETEAIDVASDQYCATVSFLLLVEACEFEWRVGSIISPFHVKCVGL